MEGVILGLVTFIGWGIGDIFGTLASRKVGSISITIWAQIIGLGLMSLYAPFVLNDLKGYTPNLLLLNIVIALFSVGGNLAFNESLRVGVPSLVGTIASTFPVITIVSSVLFFHESISPLHLVFILIIFIGVIISSLDLRDLLKGKQKVERGILLSIIAMLSWGIYSSLLRILYPSVGWFWPIYITLSIFPITLLYMKIRGETLKNIFNSKILFIIIAYTFLQRVGDLSFNMSIGKGFASAAGPLGAAAPVLFAIIAFFVFKEKPNTRQIIGIVITLAGIFALSVSK